MNYSLLKKVIELLEEFEASTKSQKVEDFTIWLNNKLFSRDQKNVHTHHDDLLIPFKIMMLNKELKKQTKIILSNSELTSIDEYSFLLHLSYQESFRKMELIDLHNLEPPTGIEIIKRLLKNGLIEEFADNKDKRAKRIKANQKGIEELRRIKPGIDLIFLEFTKPLNLNEKIQLSGFLNKLISRMDS